MAKLTKKEVEQLYERYQWSKGFIFVYESAYKSFYFSKKIKENEEKRRKYAESIRTEIERTCSGMLADYTGSGYQEVMSNFISQMLKDYDKENDVNKDTIYEGSFLEDLSPTDKLINSVFSGFSKAKTTLDEARKTYPYKTPSLGTLDNDSNSPVIRALNFETIDLNFIEGYAEGLKRLTEEKSSGFLFLEAGGCGCLEKLVERVNLLEETMGILIFQGESQLLNSVKGLDRVTRLLMR